MPSMLTLRFQLPTSLNWWVDRGFLVGIKTGGVWNLPSPIRWSPACVACHLWMRRRNLEMFGEGRWKPMIPLVLTFDKLCNIQSTVIYKLEINDGLLQGDSLCMMHFGLLLIANYLWIFLQIVFVSWEASRRCMWSGVVSTFRCYPCCKMVRCGGSGVRMLGRFYHGKY